ncbi:GNAT domain [Macleaya cordata]|uniref:GNAT domain n=1 Tax=Macleaya cordata TaxID=56857 RepID=A0A200R0N3_MACCD|nr:GNAT domain [Macleaya cordata]
MAATISFSLFSDPQKHQSLCFNTHLLKPHHHKLLSFTPTSSKPAHPLLLLHKFHHYYNFTPPFSSSHSSSESYLNDPPRTGGFLTTQELEKLQILQNFRYAHEFEHGSLWVRVMEEEEMDVTVGLLSESFAESMSLPFRYVNLLGFLVKQYMIERRALLPNTATLIGFYRGEDGEEELAGTVEVSFNKKGSNASPPSPTPPKDSPYICNMTVKKQLRRRGIGWHLLQASEKLISQMRNTSGEVYLHCRMIDTAPFNMYTKAGYSIIKTDSILILLTLQRRKHLMCKKLPVYDNPSESDISSSEDNHVHEFPR